jgi:tRNA dimethylallyltransferase
MADSKPLLVVIGPTASGKSDLALEIAQKTQGEILSVDSMQVYQGMDIGTAKPTLAEQERVKHHLIDVVQPNEPFTVARFVEVADRIITARAKPVIATGGTPLYYKSLFEGLFEGPPADESLRSRLRELPNDELHARLLKADPTAAGRIHLNDTKRLIRALEVFELTGRPISSFQTDWTDPKPRHEAVWVGLLWEKEAINRRINARVRGMMQAGWLEETRGLLEKFGRLSPTAAEATGYAELIAHLQGKMKLDDAIEQIKISTRQLARRQMKWFKRFPKVHWLAGDRSGEELVKETMRLWTAAG